MKRDNANYLAVGLVVLAVLGLLGSVLFQITGRTGAVDNYFSRYQNVYGLKYGTPVFFQGYRIGQVESVIPQRGADQTHFTIHYSVAQDWAIPTGSVAIVTSAGLLSDVYIEITEGDGVTLLQPGSEIPSAATVDVFAAFTKLAEEATRLTEESLEPMLEMLTQRLDTITSELDRQIPLILEDLRQTLGRLDEGAVAVQEVLSDGNREHVAQFLANMEQTSENVEVLSRELGETRERLDGLLGTTQRVITSNESDIRGTISDLRYMAEVLAVRIDDIARNMDSASRNFDEFTRVIRRDPSRIVWQPEPGDSKK